MADAAVAQAATAIPSAAQPRSPGGRVKRWIDGVATLVVLPLLATYRLSVRLFPDRRDLIFQSYSQSLSVRTGTVGVFLRRAFYRRTLTRCSRECMIGFGTTFATPEVEIGERVIIGNFSNIGHVSIGDDALVGSHVHVLSGKHQHYFDRLDIPIRYQGGQFTRIRIGRDVWIGNQVVILDDIGDQAVVAAGAVVTKPVPTRAIAVGNPARVVGERGNTASGGPVARSAENTAGTEGNGSTARAV